MMRSVSWLVCATLLWTTACTPNLYKTQQKYFPKPVQDLHFGMTEAEFLQSHPGLKPTESPTFRIVYLDEDVAAPLSGIVYYFDNEGDRPLYEIILIYDKATDRDAYVQQALGAPNHPSAEGEWLFDSGLGYQMNFWTYQSKLILAAAIPGSEWDENRDGVMDSAVE